MDPGVVPLAGAADSQLPPDAVTKVTVKFSVAEPALIETGWPTGAFPPIWYENVSEAGAATTGGGAVTVNVTGTASGLLDALAAVIEIVPLYVPGVRPVGLTETLIVGDACVLPLVGETLSQLPPETVDDAAVKFNTAPELCTVRFWAEGAVPPIWYEKLSAAGSVDRTLVPSVSVTGMIAGLPAAAAAVTVTVPL
jgi:hypothetical protein